MSLIFFISKEVINYEVARGFSTLIKDELYLRFDSKIYISDRNNTISIESASLLWFSINIIDCIIELLSKEKAVSEFCDFYGEYNIRTEIDKIVTIEETFLNSEIKLVYDINEIKDDLYQFGNDIINTFNALLQLSDTFEMCDRFKR